jgi:hypothetical protein
LSKRATDNLSDFKSKRDRRFSSKSFKIPRFGNPYIYKKVDKERIRKVKLLQLSSAEQDDELFLKNQKKCLIYLKKLAEIIKAQNIE